MSAKVPPKILQWVTRKISYRVSLEISAGVAHRICSKNFAVFPRQYPYIIFPESPSGKVMYLLGFLLVFLSVFLPVLLHQFLPEVLPGLLQSISLDSLWHFSRGFPGINPRDFLCPSEISAKFLKKNYFRSSPEINLRVFPTGEKFLLEFLLGFLRNFLPGLVPGFLKKFYARLCPQFLLGFLQKISLDSFPSFFWDFSWSSAEITLRGFLLICLSGPREIPSGGPPRIFSWSCTQLGLRLEFLSGL